MVDNFLAQYIHYNNFCIYVFHKVVICHISSYKCNVPDWNISYQTEVHPFGHFDPCVTLRKMVTPWAFCRSPFVVSTLIWRFRTWEVSTFSIDVHGYKASEFPHVSLAAWISVTLCGELGDQADLSVGDVSPCRTSSLTTVVVNISVKLLSKVW